MSSLSINALTADGRSCRGSQLGHNKPGKTLLWFGPGREPWRCEKWAHSRYNLMAEPTGFTNGLNVVYEGKRNQG